VIGLHGRPQTSSSTTATRSPAPIKGKLVIVVLQSQLKKRPCDKREMFLSTSRWINKKNKGKSIPAGSKNILFYISGSQEITSFMKMIVRCRA
jgi:hypothetical protein